MPDGNNAPCDCGEPFDAEKAFRALAEDIARIADAQAVRRARAPKTAGKGRSAGARPVSGTRALPGVTVSAQSEAPWVEILRHSRAALLDQPDSASEIVGGRPTREFPSCCCIGNATQFFCSAALVRPRVVLTAAHCGMGISRVFIGGWDIKLLSKGELVPVQEVVRHPDYDKRAAHANDITVIILAQPAQTAPVALAAASEIAAMKTCEVVGFGYNDPNRPLGFGTKRRVSVPIAALKRKATDDLAAAVAQLGFFPDFEFVAGRKFLGVDSCNGDSGGPAYLLTTKGPRLVGLTSRATAEASNNCGDGGIYVQPDKHLDWIKHVVASHGIAW